MPTANPIIEIRFGTKKLKRHTAPRTTDDPERDADREDAHDDRGHARDQRPEDDQQHDDRDDDPDRLALLEVVLGDLLEVVGRGRLAEHVDRRVAGRVLVAGSRSRPSTMRGGLVAVPDEDHVEQHRRAVLRTGSDRAPRPAGLPCPPARAGTATGPAGRRSGPSARMSRRAAFTCSDERRILAAPGGPGHHERLRRHVLLQLLLLVAGSACLLRLRVVREVEVRRERRCQQDAGRCEAEDQDHRPDADGPPRRDGCSPVPAFLD